MVRSPAAGAPALALELGLCTPPSRLTPPSALPALQLPSATGTPHMFFHFLVHSAPTLSFGQLLDVTSLNLPPSPSRDFHRELARTCRLPLILRLPAEALTAPRTVRSEQGGLRLSY